MGLENDICFDLGVIMSQRRGWLPPLDETVKLLRGVGRLPVDDEKVVLKVLEELEKDAIVERRNGRWKIRDWKHLKAYRA